MCHKTKHEKTSNIKEWLDGSTTNPKSHLNVSMWQDYFQIIHIQTYENNEQK